MALTCVTSLECIHSLSSQAMVSGGEDYPSSLHQKKKKIPYLPYFPLNFFAFCFESALLQWMHIQLSVLFHHCWNELFQSLLKQHKAEHKWYKTDKSWMISQQMLLPLKTLLCLHVTGVAAEIPCMPLWGAAKTTARCCPQLQSSVGMVWKAVLWGENAVHCVQWWLMNVIHCHIQTSAPNSLPFLLSLLLATLYCHILGCFMCCKAGEVISFWM